MGKGIDYGMGATNIDHDTGIRYGVISHHEVLQAWADSSAAEYGKPSCGYCGTEYADDAQAADRWYTCSHCGERSNEDAIYPESPHGYTYSDEEYGAVQNGDDTDIFVIRSSYYTICQFCSPCAPGAGYLMAQDEDGIKAYCFGHEWFEDGVAPYVVYKVSDDTIVSAKSAKMVGE